MAGFTLMELLIVIVLLGILVALGTGSYASSTRRGRDNRRKNDLRNIATALEAYFSDKGRYPSNNSNGEMVGCGSGDNAVCSWGGQFADQYNTLYMILIPDDPADQYRYYYVGTDTTYKLYAKLENTLDEGNGVDQDGYAGTNCAEDGNTICTYGIASLNTTPDP
jgi:general secretion pathway protein G